jgi:WD40 repeat protein
VCSSDLNVTLCGKVLAISNDGNQVVVSDTITTPNQVYIYNGSSTATAAPVDLIIPGETVTAAAFSPDQLKLFLLTSTGNMYVYSTVDALTSISTGTPATDVKFSADGSFAYVAGATAANSVTAYSTCSLPTAASANIGHVTTSDPPSQIFPSPVTQVDAQGLTQNIIALEPPNVEILTASEFTQDPLLYNEFTCNPPILQSFSKGASYNLGLASLTPLYAQLVNDGTEFVVVGQNIPAVLIFNVSNGTTSSVPLSRQGFGASLPLSAAACLRAFSLISWC